MAGLTSLRKFFRRGDGQSIVEFAIGIGVVLLLIFGMLTVAGYLIRLRVAELMVSTLCEYIAAHYDLPYGWHARYEIKTPYIPNAPGLTVVTEGQLMVYGLGGRDSFYLFYEPYDNGYYRLDLDHSIIPYPIPIPYFLHTRPTSSVVLECAIHEPFTIQIPLTRFNLFGQTITYRTKSRWGD